MRPLLVLAAAVSAAAPLAAVSAAAASARSASSAGGHALRLIKTSPDEAPRWLNESAVTALVRDGECGGAPHHPKPGFIDVTHVKRENIRNSTRAAERTRRRVEFPSEPRKPEEVHALIGDHLDPIGEARGLEFLGPLTEFHNRYFTGAEAVEGSLYIARWAEAVVESSGRQDAFVSLVTNPDFPQLNIKAQIAGSDPTAAPLIMGAHMDSINSDGPEENWATQRAPGADDDGSGSTAVMLAFEALLVSGFVPTRPMEFHWYAGEERGLLGSIVMADKAEQLGRLPFAMLNLDMCGGPLGEASFRFIGDFVSTSLTQFEQTLVDEYCVNTWEDGECGYACSDHASWHEVGVPASFPIEAVGSRDPVTGEGCAGHTADDRLECVDFANILDYARLAVAYSVELHDYFE
jgi:leucyl aminopeptidase